MEGVCAPFPPSNTQGRPPTNAAHKAVGLLGRQRLCPAHLAPGSKVGGHRLPNPSGARRAFLGPGKVDACAKLVARSQFGIAPTEQYIEMYQKTGWTSTAEIRAVTKQHTTGMMTTDPIEDRMA